MLFPCYRIVFLTLISYKVLLRYKKRSMVITSQAGQFGNRNDIDITNSNTFYIDDQSEVRFYYLNEILTYILTFRVILLIKITLKFSCFYSSQIGRLCRVYSTNFDTDLVFKLCMKYLPRQTLMGLFLSGMVLFGYSLELAERAFYRDDIQNSIHRVMSSLWVTLTTIATVGYGEFYPTTDLGHGLGIIRKDQCYNYYEIDELGFTYQNLKNKNKKVRKKQQHSPFQDSINNLRQMKRQYRNIDGEDSMTKAKRKFKDITFMFHEYFQQLKEFKRLQLINTINYYYVYESKVSFSQKQNSNNLQTNQTDDKQSKDEAFFEKLQKEESNLYVMKFPD
ncbi:unnamed protein product [Paramecium sonneborni]|uniref:Potassium channel domain-containing protein n=1 Tax=Paramecium sonneborni TaxID=65129 RepID=A0A8S1REX5_9CILI|nr:unnamed protein product [Paramecium sonneborni]